MSIDNPPILADLILKNKIIDDFAKKYNITKEFIDKNYDLFLEYAEIKLGLLEYTSSIPLEELKNFNTLNFRQAKFFLTLHTLLNSEIDIF